MAKRGYTLVETVIAVGLLGIMVAALAVLFGFTAKRSLHTVARFAALRAGAIAARDIEATIANSVGCAKAANGGTDALVCTMPLNGSDTDGDGTDDAYTPLRISKRGYPRYGSGKRVWYFLGDINGQFGNGGSYLFRAVRNDAANPTIADIDATWSWDYAAGRPKRGPFTAMSLTVDATADTVQYGVTVSSTLRNDQTPANGEASQTLVLSGTTHWRYSP